MKTDKVISLKNLVKKLGVLRAKNTIVFTNGCFDILHAGHVFYLDKARTQGDILIVGLNSDRSVNKIKGPKRPLNSQGDRAKVLAALACVDFVVIFNETTPYRLIKTLRPDVLVKGGDWPKDKIVGRDIVKAGGGKIVTIPTVKNRSTTNIIKKIQSTC